MKRFDNILIIRTDRIGDVVLTTPAIKALRKAYPMAKLSILVAPSTKDLVWPSPYLDEVLVDDRAGRHQGVIGLLKLARDIRRKHFDAVFVFHTKRRSNLVAFLAGIPFRTGYKNEKLGFLLTNPIKDFRTQGQKHEAQYCLDVLKTIGAENNDLDLFVATQKEAEIWANEWLNSYEVKSGEMIAVHCGSSDPAKCWPVEKFAKLMDALHQRYNLKIVLLGAGDTVECSHQIKQQTTFTPLDVTGQTSLAQTVSLLRRCRLLISNDSGPVHIAAAVGINVISLFMRDQPGINPQRWKPLTDKGLYLYSAEGLEIKDVLEAVERVLHKDHQKIFHW